MNSVLSCCQLTFIFWFMRELSGTCYFCFVYLGNGYFLFVTVPVLSPTVLVMYAHWCFIVTLLLWFVVHFSLDFRSLLPFLSLLGILFLQHWQSFVVFTCRCLYLVKCWCGGQYLVLFFWLGCLPDSCVFRFLWFFDFIDAFYAFFLFFTNHPDIHWHFCP